MSYPTGEPVKPSTTFPIRPYPADAQAVIDSLWAQRDALEKRLADTEADWCVALINGTESDTDVINRVCRMYLAFRDGTKVNELRRTERPEAHA